MRRKALGVLGSRGALVAVAALVVALTVATFAQAAGEPSPAWPVVANVAGILLAVEWALRIFLPPTHRKAPRGALLDGLAALSLVLPTARVPALLLLRLLRAWTLVRRFDRFLAHPVGALRRGSRTLLVVTAVVVCTVLFGTAAILVFERGQNPALAGFDRALWFSFYSLFAQEPGDRAPYSLGGHLVTLGMMFTGLGTFAVLTGTVSALVSERIRSPELLVDWQDLRDHLIICGWSRKAEVVVREYRAHLERDRRAHRDDLDMPVVVIAELDHPPAFTEAELRPHVQFLNDDFTKVAALEKAGVRRASRVVLLSDTTRGRRERDADARTILAALTIEKLNHDVYTCAEINRREYGAHLEMGNVNDYVVAGEHSAFLLAQGALNRGMVGLFTELFSRSAGNRLCHAEVGACWKGRTFFDLFVHLKESEDAILVAVEDGTSTVLNPHAYELRGGERVVLIAAHDVKLESPPGPRRERRWRGPVVVTGTSPRFALERRPEGLYLPALDLFLDPSVPVPRAFVSHAHGDHAGALGSPLLVASRETLALAVARAPAGTPDAVLAAAPPGLDWGEGLDVPTSEGTARITLAPAGHVLGAAQLVVDHPRGRLVYTGDYQAGGGETHAAGAPVACDELIVESTFALPIFRFPDREATRQAIVDECRAALAAGDAPVVLAYALGKAQEIIAALLAADIAVVAHGAVRKVSAVYESLGIGQGIADGRLRAYADEKEKEKGKGAAKDKPEAPAVLVTPPRTRQQPMVKKRKRARILYASGWALLDASLERHRADRGFALSDHADHDELMTLVRAAGARHVFTVHGDTESFAQMLRDEGISATAVESAALDRGEDT